MKTFLPENAFRLLRIYEGDEGGDLTAVDGDVPEERDDTVTASRVAREDDARRRNAHIIQEIQIRSQCVLEGSGKGVLDWVEAREPVLRHEDVCCGRVFVEEGGEKAGGRGAAISSDVSSAVDMEDHHGRCSGGGGGAGAGAGRGRTGIPCSAYVDGLYVAREQGTFVKA